MKGSLIKSREAISALRRNNELVSSTLAFLAPMVKPGVRTIELDRAAEDYIRSHGAEPAFKGYEGFPYSLCISVNEVVVHGFPGDYELREGDVVSVDCGTYMDSYYGDSAFTFFVGEVSDSVRELCRVTRESLEIGIQAAVAGNRIGDIGHAVQSYVESFGYGVVREMAGHGLGTHLHEKPLVPNYGRVGRGALLREGMVLCIEPMVTLGSPEIYQASNGWEIITSDKSFAAHFEKAVVIGKGGADVLTSFDAIDNALGA